MRIIYEPKGRALEYAPLAVNLYRGCDHGCIYCYAPAATRTERAAFIQPTPRLGSILKLRSDLIDMQKVGDEREVLMSFTCDPYQLIEAEFGYTREALLLFAQYRRHCSILTKGGLRSTADFDILATQWDEEPLFKYGATLVFIQEKDRQKWEPNASPTKERIEAIKKAHYRGIPTWVSIEPVIDPKQSLFLIGATAPWVDHFKVGKVNHLPEIERSIDWPKFREDAIELLESLGKSYYIKQDLREAK